MKYLRLLRVKHYMKNALVFLPLFFAVKLTVIDLLLKTLLAFAIFCLLSSAVYIINDIMDADKDRLHPVKRTRPIASGAVNKRTAIVICAVLLLSVVALIGFFSDGGLMFWLVPAAYFALNVGYSMGLKHIPIVDIAILASGFLFRVLYGSVFSGIMISGWLYLTVIALAFYLGLGKRRGEILTSAGDHTRPVLRFYNPAFLDKNMLMCVTLGIVFYSLWTVDAQTIARVGGQELVWTVPLVIMIFFKYSMTVEGKSDGDPVEVILKDKLLLILVALLGLALLGIVYF